MDWRRSGPVQEVVTIVAIVVGLVLMHRSRACSDELSGTIPKGVPDPSGWPERPVEENVERGTFVLANTTITFNLTVEPGSPGYYRVSTYRTCDHAAKACDPETLVWMRMNPSGRGAKAIVFYRFRQTKFLIFKRWYWYQVPDGSPEYLMELVRARRLYGLAVELRLGYPPEVLTF